MSLLDRIQKDMVDAMKRKEEARLSAIRMIKAALKKHEVDSMKPLDESTELQVLGTLVKQRRDSNDFAVEKQMPNALESLAKICEATNRREQADRWRTELAKETR